MEFLNLVSPVLLAEGTKFLSFHIWGTSIWGTSTTVQVSSREVPESSSRRPHWMRAPLAPFYDLDGPE